METAKTPAFMLNVAALRALAKHVAAKKDIRFYLNGVHVEPHPEGVIYSATNGHMAARFLQRNDENQTKPPCAFILEGTALETLKKPAKSASDWQKLEACEMLDECHVRIGALIVKTIDGKFPDFNRIIPTANDRNGVAAQLNHRYVKAINDAYDDIAGNPFTLGISYNGADAAALAQKGDFVAVIMPMRTDMTGDGAPHWATYTYREEDAVAPVVPSIDTFDAVATSVRIHTSPESFTQARRAIHLIAGARTLLEAASKPAKASERISDSLAIHQRARRLAMRKLLRAGAVFMPNTGHARTRSFAEKFNGVQILAPQELTTRPAWLPKFMPSVAMSAHWQHQIDHGNAPQPLWAIVHTQGSQQPAGFIQAFTTARESTRQLLQFLSANDKVCILKGIPPKTMQPSAEALAT